MSNQPPITRPPERLEYEVPQKDWDAALTRLERMDLIALAREMPTETEIGAT